MREVFIVEIGIYEMRQLLGAFDNRQRLTEYLEREGYKRTENDRYEEWLYAGNDHLGENGSIKYRPVIQVHTLMLNSGLDIDVLFF